VLAAALEIIDRDGTDALSMRRLARALDRDPMILYRHAPNKAALLDGVAETVLAQLHVDSADPDWAGQLREVARRYRALALAHPHVVPLIVTRPLATPLALRPLGTLRPLEDILALLTPGPGLAGPTPCTSTGPVRIPARPRPRRAPGTHRQPRGDRRPAPARPAPAPGQRIPPNPRPGPALAAYDGAAELERGLDILLTGLTATLTPPAQTRPAGPAQHPAS
jgi:AcrR family transcriptional regulator